MMRIYIGESDRWKDKPLYNALVEAMRANDIAGVLFTVASSVMARTGGFTRTRLSTSPTIARSCFRPSIPRRNCAFLPLVDQMVEEGLVVLSDVDIIKYSYRALDVDMPESVPGSASGVSGG